MANHNRPTNAFLPGNKEARNGGRPPTPIELVEARKLTKVELDRLINKYLHAEQKDIQKVIANPESKVIDVFICKILQIGAQAGCPQRLGFLIERLIGKVKENIQVEHQVNIVQIDAKEAARLLEADPFRTAIEGEFTKVEEES